jgi:hypothetical protein
MEFGQCCNDADVFKFDTNFKEHEARYQQIKRGILGESSDEEGSGSEGESRCGALA